MTRFSTSTSYTYTNIRAQVITNQSQTSTSVKCHLLRCPDFGLHVDDRIYHVRFRIDSLSFAFSRAKISFPMNSFTQTCLTFAPFFISDFAPGVVEVEIQSQFNCARWLGLGHNAPMHLNNSNRRLRVKLKLPSFLQYFCIYLNVSNEQFHELCEVYKNIIYRNTWDI